MSDSGSFAGLIGDASELVMEEERVRRDQISEAMIGSGMRLRTQLLRLDVQIAANREYLATAAEMRAEIREACKRLENLLWEVKVLTDSDRAKRR